MHFAQFAHKVTMLVRADSLEKSMSKYLIDQIAETPNIEICTNTELVEVMGEERLECLVLKNNQTSTTNRVPATSVFIFIGASPETGWLSGVVETDDRGFILSATYLPQDGDARKRGGKVERERFLFETSVPGIFAAGDVRHGSVKRVASGVGEGAICVQMIHQYLAHLSAQSTQSAAVGQ